MLLLILCLILLAHQGSTQHVLDKDEIQNDEPLVPAKYRASFSCVGRVAGYYADIESGCQLYHMCDGEGRRFTHSCPNATLFQQRMMICDHWYMVNCNNSEHDYSANLLIGQRDKPFVGSDHVHHREPVNFFRIKQSPGSLQQPNWFPVIEHREQEQSSDEENAVPQKKPESVQFPAGHITFHPPSSIGKDSQEPETSRQGRYRDINSHNNGQQQQQQTNSRIHSSISASSAVRSDQRNLANVPSRSVYNPVPFINPPRPTLPQAYAKNPFFQNLTPTPIATPQTTKTDRVNTIHNSSVQIHPTRPVDERRRVLHSQSSQLEDIANVRVSDPRPQISHSRTSLSRKTKEFSDRLDNTEDQNLPPFFQQQVPDLYTNNPFFQSLSLSTIPVSPITTPRSTVSDKSVSSQRHRVSENEDDLNNIVELHLLDPRRMFFIPKSDRDVPNSNIEHLERGNSTVLFISLPTPSHNDKNDRHVHSVMHFKSNVKETEGRNPSCPRCHPGFLIPGRCQPCVIIR